MVRVRSVLVIVGSFLNLFICSGFNRSIGVFVVEWQEEFLDSSAEQIGWIFSFSLIGYCIAGKLIGRKSHFVHLLAIRIYSNVIKK